MKICFATNNEVKRIEITTLLKNDYTILSLKDIGCTEELPETHDTLEENSKEKAEYVWNNYGISCFADDSGLEVKALGGEPGVYSAMYAGPECLAKNNIELLLKNLLNNTDRAAIFRTVITLILEGEIYQFEGTVEGNITYGLEGSDGFGYDPVFMPRGYTKTFAMMKVAEKNQISHRGKAVNKLAAFLLNRVNG